MAEDGDGPGADSDPAEAPAGAAEEGAPEHRDDGLELARAIARGLAGRTRPVRPDGRRGEPRRSGYGKPRPSASHVSGAHPDARDPQTLDASLGRFVADQGWETELRVHGVFTRWEALVGRDVGQHVTPESYADGRLVVRTDSTAWATQMKLLAGSVVRRLNEELGDGTVQVIDVVGPRAPSWSRGRYRVKGRGPRDTYG
ncbi:MAG TPA: DciA family protein [Marmoricola sp.]|nr:DciA family protein [Marmoricola sp.]